MTGSVDWILAGGTVESFADGHQGAEAVAIADGRFVAVGSREEVESLAGPDTKRTELRGATVFPGFCDTHMHLEKIARELAMVQLGEARDIHDVLERVSSAAASLPAGEWIRSFGDDNAWHEGQLAEERLPFRQELDRAAPENPVFVYRGNEAAALNARAVELLGERLLGPQAGSWDDEAGWALGWRARALEAELPPPSRERELEQLRSACRYLLRLGITTVVDPGLPAAFARAWGLYEEAQRQGGIPQRVYLMNKLDFREPFADELGRLQAGPILPLDGDNRLRAFAVKMILDGEFDNAWARDDAASGTPAIRFTQQELEEAVGVCGARGWPLCVHTMGGAAIACVIDVVSRAVESGVRFMPGQVSLAHVFLPSEQDLVACRELGIVLSAHPLLAYVYEREMLSAWGAELADRALPLATMRRLGAAVAGGSDTLPCAPLLGAQVAVTRTMREGAVLGAAEALAPREALGLFTRGAADYLLREDIGTISIGAVADFVVWPESPLALSPLDWPSLEPRLVAVDGRCVLGDPELEVL